MNVEQMSLEIDTAVTRRDNDRNAYIAKALMEDSSGKVKLMDSICERQNMLNALKRVKSKNGAPGIDGKLKVNAEKGKCAHPWEI